MNALAGLMSPGAIGQQITNAFEAGAQRAEQTRARNALSDYAVNPDRPENFAQLARYHPDAAIQERGRREAAQREAQTRELTARAAQGDPDAILGMWGLDPEMAMKLDDRQKAEALKGVKFIADASLHIAGLPPEQQAQAWDAYIQQGVAAGLDGLEQYRGKFSPQSLQSVVAMAGQTKQYLDQMQPDYRVVPQGGALVDVGSPQAIQQYTQGQPQQGIPPEAVEALRRGEGTPEQFDQLFGPGAATRVMGGGAGNSTGGFP